jgi:hypothetical protein
MENEDELYQKLVTLLKLFKNRPYHLSKYLIENSALTKEFKNLLLKSDKIKDLQNEFETGSNLPAIQFNEISKMQEYFKSLTEITESRTDEDIEKELNDRMMLLLKEEKYEEAAKLRDFMIMKKIKRNK